MLKIPGLRTPLLSKLIIWVQGTGNYAWVHSVNSQSYLTTHTLKWFEVRLTHFIRLNKSALINPLYVSFFERFSSKSAHVVLTNGLILPVSRRRVEAVASQLIKELES